MAQVGRRAGARATSIRVMMRVLKEAGSQETRRGVLWGMPMRGDCTLSSSGKVGVLPGASGRVTWGWYLVVMMQIVELMGEDWSGETEGGEMEELLRLKRTMGERAVAAVASVEEEEEEEVALPEVSPLFWKGVPDCQKSTSLFTCLPQKKHTATEATEAVGEA